MNNLINDLTREIYHKQHLRLSEDDRSMKRFLNMIQEEYFGLGQGYFKNKKILDAGCGDTVKLIIRLSQFGSTDLTGLDLGEEFKEQARLNLIKNKVDLNTVTLVGGSIDSLPFDDGEFDFVCCHGVLLHLANFAQVEKAFSELARVTKSGGYLYTVYGQHGGLMEAIFPAIREHYKNNNKFRSFIDNISPNNFSDAMKLIYQVSGENKHDIKEYVENIEDYFDVDFCVLVQNIIQAPTRLSISPDFVKNQYQINKLESPTRLKRFVRRENIRKFFAPLHYERDSELSKILYGDGNLEYIAKKI